jgi:3D-(3,5/4)-trihydroxycyclohexane-1,2-dione acylhydrolase (decyclizing)
LDGEIVPVDLAANAESLGAQVIRAAGLDDLKAALVTAKAASRTTVIHVETDPLAAGPDSSAWWDVPVAEVSTLDTTRDARAAYERDKRGQRHYL